MINGGESYENTVVFSGCWHTRETGVCVIAAGWPTIFTTFMGGGGRLAIGGSITAAFDVFVEDVTRSGTKKCKSLEQRERDDDGEMWDHYYSWEERIEDE